MALLLVIAIGWLREFSDIELPWAPLLAVLLTAGLINAVLLYRLWLPWTVGDKEFFANLLFDINQLTVDYGSAAVIDLPDGAPENGMTVWVIGTLSKGLFMAEQLVAGPTLASDDPGQRVQVGGIVTRFVSMADFEVNGVAATADSASTFDGGDGSDLGERSEVPLIDAEFEIEWQQDFDEKSKSSVLVAD